MQTLTLYLKQFAAWVTDLTDNYRFNPFTRATVHIITIMVILCVLLIAISGWSIQHAQNDTVGSIRYHIQEATQGNVESVASLPAALQIVRDRTLTYVFFGLVALIVLFGYLLIYFALTPTKDALQQQKRFIGNVAHEIRTPLAIIKTTTEVDLLDPTLPRDLRASLESTVAELDRISETINNLLSFDNLMQPGRMKTEPVDIEQVVNTVASRHQALAASRDVSISVEADEEHIILGNSTALEQVITNLLKNAINYTPAGGNVHLQIKSGYRNRVVITVTDTGIGIAQKDLYHVFEPFYRGDTSRVRDIGKGTSGLGLAIVNELVRIHHGTISIKSAIGHGTTVVISFPSATSSETMPDGEVIPLEKEDADEEGVYEVSLDFS
jgi:signal transduction histidine kinase